MASELTAIPDFFKKVIIPPTELPLIRFTTRINDSLSPLPPRTEIDKLYYDFRYRIVSEDKSATSAWSPIERIVMTETGSGKNPDGVSYFPYTTDSRIRVSTSGTPATITAVWNKPASPSEFELIFNRTSVYDVWVRWTTEENANESSTTWTSWLFWTTASSDSFSIVKEDPSYKTIEIAIQLPSETKIRDYNNDKVTLYKKLASV